VSAPLLDLDYLLKLRLVVARFGEMDLAKWWNTKGQLGRLGTAALRRGFPRTHRFAQARSDFAVATHRCAEIFKPRTAPIPLLRSERDACEARLRGAIRRVQEVIEGERLASVQVQPYFGSGIETEDQLDAALAGLRDECARLIGAGKKVVLS
jgi:hypothetical protein